MNQWWIGLTVLQQVMFVIGTVSVVFIALKSITQALGKNDDLPGDDRKPVEKRMNDFALYVLLSLAAGFSWMVFGLEYAWAYWWLSLILGFAAGIACALACGFVLKAVYKKQSARDKQQPLSDGQDGASDAQNKE